MPGDENKNHYSYDEMMDRLQQSRSGSRSPEGGKRKRRSHQPTLEKRRKLKFVVLAVAVLGLIALAVPVVMYMLGRGGYETEAFRLSVSNRVASMVKKEASFGRFQLSGSSLTSQQLELNDRNEAGVLQKARFSGLRADLKSNFHFGTEWPISKVVIDEAKVVLGRQSGQPPREYPPAPDPPKKPKFGLSPDPSAIVIDEVFFRDISLAWGVEGSEDTIQNGQMQAKIVGNLVSWQMIDGKLNFGGIPTMNVVNLSGEYSNNELRIEDGRIGYAEGEEGTVRGTIDMNGTGSAKLDVKLKGIKLNGWLEGQWVQRIQNGDLALNAEYTSSFRKGVPSKLSGDFHLDNVTLRKFHLFEAMHLAFNETQMNLLQFETVVGKFAWVPGRLVITEMEGEHTGVLKVAGEMSIFDSPDGPVIDAVFNMGIPSVHLREFENGPPAFLSKPKNGWVWMKLKMTGPLDEPVHDFLDQLDQELRDELPLPPWELNQDKDSLPSLNDIPGIDDIPDN